MLRDDVVQAVAAGQFHIWTASEVDEALELLTGAPAERLHRAVTDCLANYAATLKALSAEEKKREPAAV